jgi:hypothetical protein
VDAVVRSFGDDNWETTESAHVQAWKSATTLMRERVVTSNDSSYTVIIDWGPLYLRYKQHYEAMKYLNRGARGQLARRARMAHFPERASKLPVLVITDADKPTSLSGGAASVIYDAFLIMNIAAPGSCNFYRANLIWDEAKDEISLSNYIFETHLTSNNWPPPRFVDLQKVISWYDINSTRCCSNSK